MDLSRERVRELAREIGFDLSGVARAEPIPDAGRYREWLEAGMAGEMEYLKDTRRVSGIGNWVCFVICVGRLYNGPEVYSNQFDSRERGWIARYAWGSDYHKLIKKDLLRLARRMELELGRTFPWLAYVDTGAVLERSYAREAGLGWIGKNTCLIHEGPKGARGSWYFLGELLVGGLELEADAALAPDRCGTCTRCIDICPTEALAPDGAGRYRLDSRRCISYLTIELRGAIPEELRDGVGRHVFGCDLCQDVCPWNRDSGVTSEPRYGARHFAPPLERLAALTEEEFREMFRGSPVKRARYAGFLRNVAVAMGNSGLEKFRDPLERLSRHEVAMVAEHALWALGRLDVLRISD